MEEKKIALFLADFDDRVVAIERIYAVLDSRHVSLMSEPVASETVESTGYWLHNLYSTYEDLFKMVSVFWENSIDDDGAFHRNLLRRMALEIKGIRPALISDNTYRHLDELRGFRHVFRHAYSYGMDDERVTHLVTKVRSEKTHILNEIIEFRGQVAAMVTS